MEHWAMLRASAGPGDVATADRRRQRRFVLRERRTGFDRRTPTTEGHTAATALRRWTSRTLLVLRDRPVMVLALIVGMNVLSLCDFALTLRSLEQGAVELNPVIKPLLDESPWLAALVKVLLVGTASLLIWRFRRYRLVLQVALVGPLFFALINLYQVTFSFILL